MTRSQNGRLSLRLSDEELEYYADLYIGNGIRAAGVEFEAYLNNPEYYLHKYAPQRQAEGGRDGAGWRKGLRSYLRLRTRPRTPTG